MNWLITDLFTSILILFVSFIAHEAGHIIRAGELGYKVNKGFNKLNFEVTYFPNVTIKDDIKILETGIFFGFAIAMISILIVPYWSAMVLISYFVGCNYDLQRLRVLYRKKRLLFRKV